LEDIRSDVAAATVKVRGYQSDIDKVGLGVLVEGGYLVTAAHCLEYDNDTGARITLGEHVFYEIETAWGEKLNVAPVFIESISDIAVLGPLDRYSYDEEWTAAYEAFLGRTRPVPLWDGRNAGPPSSPVPEEFGIHIRSHKKAWISGKATIGKAGQPYIWIKTEERIEGGTSGGPIINDSGQLVGVVTTAGGYLGMTNEGHAPLLRYALPAGIFREMCGTEP